MKSILVIDTPKDCYDCPCYYEDRDMCEAFDKKAKADSGRPSWCPLRPLPEPKDIGYPNDDYDVGFGDGWDACLKELEK